MAGQQLKEAQAINKSLSALGDVIQSLQSKQGHVPYRNSKLTQVGVGVGGWMGCWSCLLSQSSALVGGWAAQQQADAGGVGG